jgi:predicted metal-binding protein
LRVSDGDGFTQTKRDASHDNAAATIFVCVTCRAAGDPAEVPRAGEALADAVIVAAADTPDIAVTRVRCLANCSRGLSAAIRRPGSWSYVFGGLDASLDAPSLCAGARLLAASGDGLMPWRDRPEALKRGLIARLPPLDFHEDAP